MGYVERSMQAASRGLRLGMFAGDSDAYDIDVFGMDDGLNRAEDATFRFLFQLGQGYMIHLYVVAARQPGSGAWFHTFWTKDCAVYHVDMEEHGPPGRVLCEPLVLPELYRTFVLEGPGPGRRFQVLRSTFAACVEGDARRIEVEFELAGPDDRPGALSWSSAGGWRLHEADGWRALVLGERVTFTDPAP